MNQNAMNESLMNHYLITMTIMNGLGIKENMYSANETKVYTYSYAFVSYLKESLTNEYKKGFNAELNHRSQKVISKTTSGMLLGVKKMSYKA